MLWHCSSSVRRQRHEVHRSKGLDCSSGFAALAEFELSLTTDLLVSTGFVA